MMLQRYDISQDGFDINVSLIKEPSETGYWIKATDVAAMQAEYATLREIVAGKRGRCPACDKWERAREFLGLPWKQYPENLKKIFDASEE